MLRRWAQRDADDVPLHREGDALAIAGPPTAEWVSQFLGLSDAGWAVGVIDPYASPREVEAAVEQLAPAVMLVDQEVDSEAYPLTGYVPWNGTEGSFGYAMEVYVHGGGRADASAARDEDVFYVGFTSGSAGVPKAFARTHRSWWESFVRFDPIARLGPGDVVTIPGPLSSSHFLFGALHALHAGALVHLTDGSVHASVPPHAGVRAMYVVPTMLAGLCARPPADPVDIIFCAGARLEAALVARVREAFPDARLVEYYGASELSFVAIREDGDGTPAGSVGQAFPGVEIAIRDTDGGDCVAGEEGVIHVRSDLVFAGYRGHPPQQAVHPDPDGWLTVGDRGRLDAHGYLWVAGRGSALIIQGGVNVQPEEVEETIAAAAGVRACVAVGVDDARWGQVVCVAVVADPEVTRADLRAHVAHHIAPARRPRRYVRIDHVPVLPSGKVDRATVAGWVTRGDCRELA